MKAIRYILFCLGLFIITDVVAQQSITSIQRYRGKLAIPALQEHTKPIQLTKIQLQELLSQEQYKSYKTARNRYTASIPLLTLAGCGMALNTIWFVLAINENLNPHYYANEHALRGLELLFLSAITHITTLSFFIPGIILATRGVKRLNKISSDYNFQHGLSYQPKLKLNIGIAGSGIGMKLTF